MSHDKLLSGNILKYPTKSGLRYSKNTIRKAGIVLKEKNITIDQRDDAMFVLSNYRASHETALLYVTNELYRISITIDKDVIVAKRFKRTPSIIRKLRRFKSMELDRMQDIAGCRAIFSNIKKLEQSKRALKKIIDFRVKDYISKPKEDGYRGVHLICKCNQDSSEQNYFIEVQLRTKIQHSWATAVEIVDLLTNQKLKSNEGEQEWLDFFKVIGTTFEMIEDDLIQPSREVLRESVSLIKKMKIQDKFSAFTQSLKFIEHQEYDIEIGYNLILIDLEKKQIKVESYPKDAFELAAKNYLVSEQEASNQNNLVTALVSTESVTNLKEAYPNYFADSGFFLKNILKIESLYKQSKPKSFIEKLIQSLSNFEDQETRKRNLEN